jgi:hypothetical protein
VSWLSGKAATGVLSPYRLLPEPEALERSRRSPQMMPALALPAAAAVGSIDAYIVAARQFSMLTRDEESRLASRYQDKNDLDAARQLIVSHPPSGGFDRPWLPGVWLAARRSDPGGQYRADEGGEALRPDAWCAPGFLRHLPDQGRDSGVRREELADAQGGNHQRAAQAVFQPAQHERQQQQSRLPADGTNRRHPERPA